MELAQYGESGKVFFSLALLNFITGFKRLIWMFVVANMNIMTLCIL